MKNESLGSPEEHDLCRKITDLMEQRRIATQAEPNDEQQIQRIDTTIMELLDSYLRMSLLPVLAKMFGPNVYSRNKDSSARLTVMLNELFVKILEGEADDRQFENARHLRNWCSCVIRNQMLNHIEQKKQRQQNFQSIAPLYDAHRNHFENRFGADTYDRAVLIIESWTTQSEKHSFDKQLSGQQRKDYEQLKQFAVILDLHYVMGVPWDGVCDTLGISKSTFHDKRNQALQKLHDEL